MIFFFFSPRAVEALKADYPESVDEFVFRSGTAKARLLRYHKHGGCKYRAVTFVLFCVEKWKITL